MRILFKRYLATALAGLCFLPLSSFGHHSVLGSFDVESIVELQGEVTEVHWRNPHASIALTVEDENGRSVSWKIETNSSSSSVKNILAVPADGENSALRLFSERLAAVEWLEEGLVDSCRTSVVG